MGDMKYRGHQLGRPFRYLYLRFIRLRGTAEDVARGMALGVFIGITPTMGIQMPIAFFFAMLLKENKIAALIGVWISNPMTAIPIYTYNFKIGKYLLGTPDIKMPDFSSLSDIMALGHDLILPLTLGSLIAGFFSAIIAYFVTLKAYAVVQMEREMLAKMRAKNRLKKEMALKAEKNRLEGKEDK
jgi:uncharacterized protein (DUF2062 family)